LVARRDCERVGFAEKSSQAWGGGVQVPYLDSDATCPRDQPTCDSGEFTNTRVSVRVDLPELMEQGAVPTRSGNALSPLLTIVPTLPGMWVLE